MKNAIRSYCTLFLLTSMEVIHAVRRNFAETQQPLPVEAYAANRVGGSLIIVDPASNRTSGALLVEEAA